MSTSHPVPESETDARRFAWMWRVTIAGSALGLGWLVWQQGAGVLLRLLALSASAQVAGKWLIFVGATPARVYGFGHWGVAVLISAVDLWIGLLLNTFLPRLERMPRVGPWVTHTRRRAVTSFAQYPALKRMAFWGVVLWVALPLPASGAITGAFATRLVGLSRPRSTAAIVLGSVLNGGVFAILASLLGAHGRALVDAPEAMIASLLALSVVGWLGFRALRQTLRQ